MTPRYVVGFAAERELPIVGKIAIGSLRNKMLFLLPAALLLQAFAPWAITPLLMLGGAYLCYEGTEKVYEALFPHKAHAHEAKLDADAGDGQALEARKVSSAIKTDFILSAEIMAISLASLPEGSIWTKAIVLAVVAIGITVFVYGGVALIVKADDAGVAMAKNNSASVFGSAIRGFGRALVQGHAGLPAASGHHRYSRDDLGRRRHPRPWSRRLRPAPGRPRDPRSPLPAARRWCRRSDPSSNGSSPPSAPASWASWSGLR